MNTPRTLFYSNSGPKAVHSFLDINLGNEKHDETSRDEGQKGATTVHEDSIDTWQDHDDDIPDSLDDYNSGTESVRASPDLSSSVFSDNSSQYSSQTEGDEKEFLSDHPLMGKDVIGIRKSFAAVKSSEYDAHPPKSIYRGFVSIYPFFQSNTLISFFGSETSSLLDISFSSTFWAKYFRRTFLTLFGS